MPKMNCPMHADTNASMEVYDDGFGFCFVCWKQYKLEDKPLKKKQPKPKEDIQYRMNFINSLPVKPLRGLMFPTSDRGYFLVWPEQNYYKFRQFNPGEGPKYIGPAGHQPPLFKYRSGNKSLIIIEGELNALSLCDQGRKLDNFDIISPGSAGHFEVHKSELIEMSKEYSKIILWTDNDFAGHEALLNLAPLLNREGLQLGFIWSDRDANDILVSDGILAVRERLENYVKIE